METPLWSNLFAVTSMDSCLPETVSKMAAAGDAALSVWHPRVLPHLRASERLKLCNRRFLELCEVSHLPSGDVATVLPYFNQSFDDPGLTAILDYGDAIHRGETDGGEVADMIHVTHHRRVRRVWSSLIAIRRDGILCELVWIERLLPEHPDRPLYLEEWLLSRRASPPAASPPPRRHSTPAKQNQDSPDSSTSWVFIDEHERKPQQDNSGFVCGECGSKMTMQKRRGPDGPGTLCNRCGLRWIKALRAKKGAGSDS